MPGIRFIRARIITFLFAATVFLLQQYTTGCSDDDYNPCPRTNTLCDNKCVDIETDDDNCGECGNDCGFFSDCVQGVCECVAGNADCDGQQANGCEVRTDDDPEHCGGCGQSCPAGFTCCYGWCVDLYTDEYHCGSCGTTCLADEFCEGASCIKINKCEDLGFSTCDDECVDLSSNFHHCGSCNSTCGEFQYCENGQCECFSGLENCNGTCKNIRSDVDNCGECGFRCGTCEICIGGACNIGDCGPFDMVCTDSDGCIKACVADPQTNDDYCGNCYTRCSDDQFCADGICQYKESCSDRGLTNCDGYCVDTENDPNYCGDCDTQCEAGQSCVGGVCQQD